MNIKIYSTKEDAGAAAAALYNAQVIRKPNCVLGLATGSSVLPTYQVMIDSCKKGLTDYSNITTFNLDEYAGLPGSHDQSYRYFMNENLFNHINIPKENTHVLNGFVTDYDAECASYEEAINKAGGIDLQLLGIGHNGHIAFNEPDDSFPDKTHLVTLTESTIKANARFFENENEVPRASLTVGIGTIMRAKEIILVASGNDKAEAIYNMVHGPITPNCPASILQVHPNVHIILDEAAASMLKQ